MPRDLLDQVYRHISLGRYQEAIHILNRQIKKQPDFLVLKVWKCEALYGLGNVSESEELMATIFEQAPLDKRTIDCIADYYRARGNYSKLIEIYEEALKQCPTDESWRKGIFECCGLAGDYKKQQQQALILYKQNPIMLYYGMAVVCLLQQAKDNKVALELAGRMMVKQYESGKITSNKDILLMITVLERQKKFEDALFYLIKHASDLNEMVSILDKKLLLLENLNRWPELIELVKENLSLKPDNWMHWKLYLKSVLKLQEIGGCVDSHVDDSVERARDFLTKMADLHKNLRGPSLAALELLKLTKTNDYESEMSRRLEKYFVDFGEKTICVFDLFNYVTLLPKSKFDELLTNLSAPNFRIMPAIDLQTKMGPSKHISFLQIGRVLGEHACLSLMEHELFCLDLEKCYLAAEDCDRREQYLQLLTQECFHLYSKTGDISHLIKAASQLEKSLAETSVFALQLLLLRVYFTLGASKVARKIYEQLRIQSVQVDTLIHLFLATLSSTGHFSMACDMWDSALKILKQCATESLEALVICYRGGLFHRVEEITECARRFQFTISVPLLQGEKNFLDIVMGEPSRAEQVLQRSRSSVSWENCLDNRDLKALANWEPPSSQEKAAESFAELLLLCKIRESTISCLSTAIALGKQRGDIEEKNFRSALETLKLLYIEALALPVRNVSDTRLNQIVQNPLPTIMENLLEPDLPSPDTVCTTITNGVEGCVKLATASVTKNPRTIMEAVVTQIELLAVVTVVCGAARTGLPPVPRRRCDQIVRCLETAWSNLESCLPNIKLSFVSLSSSNDNVERKLREDVQAASEELRKVIRKKITYLHKLISN